MSAIQTSATILLAATMVAAVPTAHATGPEGSGRTAKAVDLAMKAAGGANALAGLGILKAHIHNEETTAKGEQHVTDMTAWVNGADLEQLRLQYTPRILLVDNGIKAWAMIDGQLDTRRQTPLMARTTLHDRLFPLLLPFSLGIEGVRVTSVTGATWEGEPVWKLTVEFPPNYFTTPIFNTPWELLVRRSDGRLLVAQLFAPEEYLKVGAEGVRYRFLRWEKVGPARLASDLLVVGIDQNGAESGHVRTVKVRWESLGMPSEPLFMHPEDLEAMEEGDLPGR